MPLEKSAAALAAVDLSYYRITAPAAMQALFERLQRQQVAMTLLADVQGEGDTLDVGGRACGVAVFSVVQAEQLLVLEVSGAQQPLPAQVLLVAHHGGGVRTQWELAPLWTALPNGRWQLHAPWPTLLVQHQRRRHPRVQLPLGQQGYQASFMFGRRQCVLHLEDVSQGGVGLRGSRSETAMLFMGRKLGKVVLDLGDAVQVQVDLTVRSRRSYHSFLLGEQIMVGCSLEGMSEEVQAALARLTAGSAMATV